MNQRISAYIDGLFEGVKLEGEAAELHDELKANCSERFDDLIRQGYTENDAFAFVREGMGDIEELISPYRTPRAAQAPRMEEEAAPYFEQAFNVQGIHALEVATRDASITIQPNSGEELVVLYEAESAAGFVPPSVTRSEGLIRVEVPRRESPSFSFDLESTLQSIVNVFTGKALRGARLTLCVPKGMMPALSVQGGSGSFRLEGVALRGADVHLASGSIRLETDARIRGGVYALHTSSGSVRCCAAADEITLQSMSGSVKAECDARVLNAHAVSGSVRVEGMLHDVNAKSVSGSVHVTCKNADVHAVCAHSVSGSVHVSLPETLPGMTFEGHSVSGRVHNAFGVEVYGTGDTHVTASSTSGSVHVEKA